MVDAYLHEGKIDRDTSQDQLARLREDHTLAEMELNAARVDELDIEAVVNFVTNVSLGHYEVRGGRSFIITRG